MNSDERTERVAEDYTVANRYTYWALFALEHIANMKVEDRKCFWTWASNIIIEESFTPSRFFGEYDDDRFDRVVEVVFNYWIERYNTGGLYKPVTDGTPTDPPLNTDCTPCSGAVGVNVPAGPICLCDQYFDYGNSEDDTLERIVTLIHEQMHWVLTGLRDTHTCNGKTKRWYYHDDVDKLAQDCPEDAVDNIDNYSYWIYQFGRAVDNGLAWAPQCYPRPKAGNSGSGLECVQTANGPLECLSIEPDFGG